MPPFPFAGDDALRLTSFNAAAGVTLTLEARVELETGAIQSFSRTHTPNTDRTTASTTFPMGVGRLLEAQVRASAGAPRRGQCFVILEIVRGLESSQVPLSALLQGYVTNTQRRGWPASPFELSTEGPGVMRSIAGTDPAAGAEIAETVPTNARWRLRALLATLVSDGNAANREAALTIDDGTTVFLRATSALTQIASQTRRYSWAPYFNRATIAQDTTVTIPIPDLWLPGGFRINTLTTGILAGDNWSAPQFVVEELIED